MASTVDQNASSVVGQSVPKQAVFPDGMTTELVHQSLMFPLGSISGCL